MCEELSGIKKDRLEKEGKMKLLVKEVKTLLQKNEDL